MGHFSMEKSLNPGSALSGNQHKGIWWRIFAAMSDDPDFEYLIVDSTVIRAHQHASGAKKGLKIRPLAVLAAV